MFDEDARPAPRGIAVGDDLADLSIEELEERIDMFKAEIKRVETALDAKRSGRAAADAVFGGG